MRFIKKVNEWIIEKRNGERYLYGVRLDAENPTRLRGKRER